MKRLKRQFITAALAIVLLIAASPVNASATGAEMIAGSVLYAGLQAAGINFSNALSDVILNSDFGEWLNEKFNDFCVATSATYNTFLGACEYFGIPTTPQGLFSEFFHIINPVYQGDVSTQSVKFNEDFRQVISDFAAWLKTNLFGENADSDGGTVSNPTSSAIQTSSYYEWNGLKFGYMNYSAQTGVDNATVVRGGDVVTLSWDELTQLTSGKPYEYIDYVAPSGLKLVVKIYYSYYSASTRRIYMKYSYGGDSDSNVTTSTGYISISPDSVTGAFPSQVSFTLAGGYLKNSNVSAYARVYFGFDDNVFTNDTVFSTTAIQIGSWADITGVTLANMVANSSTVSDSLTAENTNNNQIPASIGVNDSFMVVPAGATVLSSYSDELAAQQVQINGLTYAISDLVTQLNNQTIAIGQQTETFSDLWAAILAVTAPTSSLTTTADAIQAAESAANGTGQIDVNGLAYTLAQLLQTIQNDDVTITDGTGAEHVVPVTDVINPIINLKLTPEAIAQAILTTPEIMDRLSITYTAPAVSVGSIAEPTTAPTTAPVPTTTEVPAPTAIPTTVESAGIISEIRALPDSIASAIAQIFVPDTVLLNEIYGTFYSKFGWLETLRGIITGAMNEVYGDNYIPIIYIYPHGMNNTDLKYSSPNGLKLAPDGVEKIPILDMTWYAPYRAMVNDFLAGLLWLTFIWKLFSSAPDIIGGAGMTQDQTQSYGEIASDVSGNSGKDIKGAVRRGYKKYKQRKNYHIR